MSLHVVSKAMAWSAEEHLPADLERPEPWHIKSVQDAVAFDLMAASRRLNILEIGGGRSRLLPWLGRDNFCYLADPLDGNDGGPTSVPPDVEYEVIRESVHRKSPVIETFPSHFQIVFSISVVEHVRNEELTGFFSACHKLLEPGGRMIHLIDLYITNSLPSAEKQERLLSYLAPLESMFTVGSDAAPIDATTLSFETWMASNPDNMMQSWNKSVPQLTSTRETHQAVTLLMDYIKVRD